MVAAGFLSRYVNGPLPYVRRHITVNKNVLSVSLNKTFPSAFLLFVLRVVKLWLKQINASVGPSGGINPVVYCTM